MKKSVEHFGESESHKGAEHPHVSVGNIEVQTELARIMDRRIHREKHERYERGTDKETMMEWIGHDIDNPQSFAAAYRQYVEGHPDETVDIQDADALAKLLKSISALIHKKGNHQA